MEISNLQAACDGAGFGLVERSEHHYQVCAHQDGKWFPLVEVWPSTNKFLEHKAPAGHKARVGGVGAVIKAAQKTYIDRTGSLWHPSLGRAAAEAAAQPEPAKVPQQPASYDEDWQGELHVGTLLFEFDSFEQWVNKASSWFGSSGYRSEDTVCIDAKGRICRNGRHFMTARDDNAFPVKVLVARHDPELDSAAERRAMSYVRQRFAGIRS